jgi:hypothetical protein
MLTSVHVLLFIDTYSVQSQSEEHTGGLRLFIPSRLEVPHIGIIAAERTERMV